MLYFNRICPDHVMLTEKQLVGRLDSLSGWQRYKQVEDLRGCTHFRPRWLESTCKDKPIEMNFKWTLNTVANDWGKQLQVDHSEQTWARKGRVTGWLIMSSTEQWPDNPRARSSHDVVNLLMCLGALIRAVCQCISVVGSEMGMRTHVVIHHLTPEDST